MQTRRWSRYVTLCALAVVIAGCGGNPFFPDTGPPVAGSASSRATPKGVIDQLINSYTNRRIDLFEELFDAGSFRFYVSPRLVESGTSIEISREEIDSVFTYVPRGVYYYWTYEKEHRSHQRLFSAATSVSITMQPLYGAMDFVYHVSAGGDTVGVEVLMVGGEISIAVPDPYVPLTTVIYSIVIERQVFYLVRDSQRNWLIRKWFDFGTSAGDPS